MNIPLAKKSKTATTAKRPLAYGLNPRQEQAAGSGSRTTTRSSFNVLHDNDDEADNDDDNDNDNDGNDRDATGSRPKPHQRSRVNAELAREQAAVRRRVQQEELQQQQQLGDGEGGPPVYEYDDEGHPPPPTTMIPGSGGGAAAAPASNKAPLASRYLGGLLKAAEERKRERELLLERKIIREQDKEVGAAQDEGPQFVTAAYRRKLEEREAWQRNRKVQEEREAAADVTLGSNAGMAMAQFYSRLNDNVALGGGDDDNYNDSGGDHIQTDHGRGDGPAAAAVDSDDRGTMAPVGAAARDAAVSMVPATDRTTPAAVAASSSVRAARRDKVRQARTRYLVRHPEMRRQVGETA